MPPEETPDVDPRLAEAVRRAYARPVDEGTAARHVAMLAAAARDAGTAPVPVARRRRRPRLWRPLVAAGAASLLLPAALATAGVDLPGSVDAPYEAVGIDLPHQHAAPARRESEPPPVVTATPTPAAAPTTTAPAPTRAEPAARPRRKPRHTHTPTRARRRPHGRPARPQATPPRVIPRPATPQRKGTPQRPATAGPKPKRAPQAKHPAASKPHRHTKPLVPPGRQRKGDQPRAPTGPTGNPGRGNGKP